MEPLLRLENVSKSFRLKGNRRIFALQDVNLEIYKGETLGIVGESGCGKSTLARTIMGVYPQKQGNIYFRGEKLDLRKRQARLIFAQKVQMIFQDPYTSLNPRMKVENIVAENLLIHNGFTKSERKKRTAELLESVGLQAEWGGRFPNEFSGGQRQRICIARALAIHPELLICDEPISALDVSIQSQIMNLLKGLGEELGLTYIFIAHDLGMVHYISDRVAVMYQGHVVELAESEALYNNPLHPYTKMLAEAVLKPVPGSLKEGLLGEKEVEMEMEEKRVVLEGCSFANRCKEVQPCCRKEKPIVKEVDMGHFVACHGAGK